MTTPRWPEHPDARRVAEKVAAIFESGELDRVANEEPREIFVVEWMFREMYLIPTEAARELAEWNDTEGQRLFDEAERRRGRAALKPLPPLRLVP